MRYILDESSKFILEELRVYYNSVGDNISLDKIVRFTSKEGNNPVIDIYVRDGEDHNNIRREYPVVKFANGDELILLRPSYDALASRNPRDEYNDAMFIVESVRKLMGNPR